MERGGCTTFSVAAMIIIVLACYGTGFKDSDHPLSTTLSINNDLGDIEEEESSGSGNSSVKVKDDISLDLGGIHFSVCPQLSCQDRCAVNRSDSQSPTSSPDISTTCQCDDLCISAGDCCVDYFLHCHNISNVKEILNIIQDTFLSAVPNFTFPDYAIIAKIYGECMDLGKGRFTVVTLCPVDYFNATTRDLCHNPDKTTPVTFYTHEAAITFRNDHCAACHGIKNDKTITWTSTLQCFNITEMATLQDLRRAFRSNKCHKYYIPPFEIYLPHSCSSPQIYPYPLTDVIITDESCSSRLDCNPEDKVLCAVYKLPALASTNQSLSSSSHQCLLSSHVFHNPHCLKCRTGISTEKIVSCCDFNCSTINQHFNNTDTILHSKSPIGLTALFHLNDDGTEVNVNGQMIKWSGILCEDNEVYDHVNEVCRQLICPPGHLLLDLECVRDDTVLEGDSQLLASGTQTIWLHLWLADGVSCQSILCGNNIDMSTEGKVLTKCSNDTGQAYAIYHSLLHLTFPSKLSCSEDGLRLTLAIQLVVNRPFEDLFNDSLSTFLATDLTDSSLFVNASMTNQPDNFTTVCPDGRNPLENYVNTSDRDGKLFVVTSNHGFQELYPMENVIFEARQIYQGCKLNSEKFGEAEMEDINAGKERYDLHPNEIYSDVENTTSNLETEGNTVLSVMCKYSLKVLLCEQNVANSSLRCPAILYSKNQTYIENDTLRIIGTDMIFGKGEFEIVNDNVLVCSPFKNLNDFWNNLKLLDFSLEQLYVMYFLTAISIFSLLAILTVYSILPELRTLPGKITSCHAVSLLLGQVSLLIDVPNKLACRFIAAFSHWVWLAAFAWISALAVQMASTFFAPAANQKTRHDADTAFRKYSLVCWGLPLAVVLMSFTIDFVPSVSVKVEYGTDVCGWIGNAKAAICTFLVPVAISLLINLLAFLAAVCGIEGTARAASLAVGTVPRRAQGQRLLVYVKISAALGFTWILGLCVAFLRWPWLLWLYAVLNSLQGTFIALAFLGNKRVLRMLKLKLARKTHGSKETSFLSMSEYQTKSTSVSATNISPSRLSL